MKDYAEHRGRAQSYCVLLICASAFPGMRPALAQAPPPMPPSTAASPSLSGRGAQLGPVTTTQSTANQGETGGSNLITTTINVQGGYQGSVPSGDNTGTVLPLSLDYALKLGLRNNLGAINQSNTELQAVGRLRVARSALLPNLNASVTETTEQINLRTLGVEVNSLPPVVGPFNFFNAEPAQLTQSILDFVRLGNLRSAQENLRAARYAALDARDIVVLAVSGSYLQIIATNARIVAARAQVDSSQAVYKQATDRLRDGLNARIDTTRTQVQLQIDQQRLRSLIADLDRRKLRLARVIGLPLGQQFNIADDFPYAPLTGMTLTDSLEKAYRNRSDILAAQAGVRAAEAAIKAAHGERLPRLSVTADYGAAGLRPTASAHGVFGVSGNLTIPLYEGGRIRGEMEQAEAALRQRKAELEDTRAQVDQDVRQAFIDLDAAADQVGVSRSNVSLAEDTLKQANDRFRDGIADTVEVVQAQQSVASAHNDYISAVFEHNLAKASLARAIGDAETSLRQFLGGK